MPSQPHALWHDQLAAFTPLRGTGSTSAAANTKPAAPGKPALVPPHGCSWYQDSARAPVRIPRGVRAVRDCRQVVCATRGRHWTETDIGDGTPSTDSRPRVTPVHPSENDSDADTVSVSDTASVSVAVSVAVSVSDSIREKKVGSPTAPRQGKRTSLEIRRIT